MANVKANANKATSATKLMTVKQIEVGITAALRTTASGLAMLQAMATQCMLHAEKHGDIRPAQRLIEGIRNELKGVVVAGFVEWFKKHSPVRFKMEQDEKGNSSVKATLLKEGDEGYKAFESAEAEANPAMETREVWDRSTRPITKPTIEYLKKRIQGLVKQIDNYQEKASSDQKMSDAEVARTKAWVKSVSEFASKVTILRDVKEEKAIEMRTSSVVTKIPKTQKGKTVRAKKASDNEENLKSETKAA